ncbi:hypothetical protein [Undibacterium sp. KW1]|uniref:hypothetical protein n=1 Tax=Undibacterium sp. KW1 TaxID=2058624 RepID=UPI001E4B289D|nr:hypothetical protein [Undibacterium sp. KW1]
MWTIKAIDIETEIETEIEDQRVKNAENQPLTVHAALQNNKALARRKPEEMLAQGLAKANFLQKHGYSIKEFARKRASMELLEKEK